MMNIECDLHTRYQQIAMVDTATGELVERRLEHESGTAPLIIYRTIGNYLRRTAVCGRTIVRTIGRTKEMAWRAAPDPEVGLCSWNIPVPT